MDSRVDVIPVKIEVCPGLFVGGQEAYELDVKYEQGWAIVHACKEPYHRLALGYKGRAAAKDHPEYLMARRGDRLILNLIDANDPAFIPDEVMDAAARFIDEQLKANRKVLVHCNQGLSRSPGIAMLYLAMYTDRFSGCSFERALRKFGEMYPAFSPAQGILGFLQRRWMSECMRVTGAS